MNARVSLISPPAPTADFGVACASTRDVDEQAMLFLDWATEYRQLSPGAFVGSLCQAHFGGLQLFRETSTQRVHQSGVAWANSLTFALPLAQSEPLRWRGVQVNSSDLGCFHGGDELDLITPPHCDLLAVTIDRDDFAAFAESVDGCDLGRRLNHAPLAPASPRCQTALKALLQTALQTVVADPTVLRHPQARKSLREAIYAQLIAALDVSGQAPAPVFSGQRCALVARARDHLVDCNDDPLSVADICRILGVSRRSLQYAFQEVLGMNPVAYLRALRLNGVRRELKAGGPDIAVLDVAARWGFWHPSHFSADYKRLFGELPSATLRRHADQREANRQSVGRCT